MNYPLLYRTIRHLKMIQMFYQLKNRFFNSEYVSHVSPEVNLCRLMTLPVCKEKSVNGNDFSFLNLTCGFSTWDFSENGLLFTYNLNYFDFINDGNIDFNQVSRWIDKYVDELPKITFGLDPYPIALRGINWIKFILANSDRIERDQRKRWNDSLYSQYKLLEKKLEWHLLGNHLLENFYSLYIASIYFNDREMFLRYSYLLRRELDEQILPDGAHFEQSPMYHCILLDRLLDCCNLSLANILFEGQHEANSYLKEKASLMLGHLESLMYMDGDIPMLNDSAQGIAPTTSELFDYAIRLGVTWSKLSLKECGYRRWTNSKYQVLLDVGNITAAYQPGHSHADTFNYELRIDGLPFVVDTGISTYEKNARRQFERSTIAHNCVSPNGRDSSEVWGGFRVGRRCHSQIIQESENSIVAWHDGFGPFCKRRFKLLPDGFIVEDWFDMDAVSYIHIAANADIKRISVEGASDVRVKDYMYSTEYNKFHKGKVVEIHFNGYIKYIIR